MSNVQLKAALAVLAMLGLTGTADGKEAKKRPEPTSKPSEPVVKNGLSISVGPVKAAFAQKEPIALDVTLRNVSKEPISLAGTRFVSWRPSPGLTFLVKDAKSGKVRTLREGTNPMIAAPVRIQNQTLPAGKSLGVRATLDRWAWCRVPVPGKPKRQKRAFLGPGLLPPGEYRVTVRCTLGKGFGKDVTFWMGEIDANPVSLRVDAKKIARPPGADDDKKTAGGQWTKLFADKPWYKTEKAKERLLTGVLQAVPGAGGPSTLMRASCYRLGSRTVYTGARTLPVLDKLVGQPVQIRGKPVEMGLEGRSIAEIWPGYVRRIRPTVSPPVTPRVSPPLKPKARPLGGTPAEGRW